MRNLWLLILAAAVLAGGFFLFHGGGEGWTSSSPEAIAEFELCREADMKLYAREAFEHCRRAVELDPDFVVAKLRVIRGLDREEGEERKKLLREVRDTDLKALSERERFLVHRFLARVDDQPDLEVALVGEYLEDHPDDPFALEVRCARFWERQEWAEAKPCYQRLLKADPNWVRAQNHLGYIAMAQGKFKEAEELFETYRFIAPDQANPYDSMGELLTLIGRYDEAEASLLKAIDIHEDFCASYVHLEGVYLMMADLEKAAGVIPLMESKGVCSGRESVMLNCERAIWEKVLAEDWDGAWAVAENGCLLISGDVPVMAHLAASISGRTEEALMIESGLGDRIERAEEGRGDEVDRGKAVLYHMQGIRAAAAGDFETAAERFADADSKIKYWHMSGLSIFKLYNGLSLAGALRRSGEEEKAREIEDRVRAVNPEFTLTFGPLASTAERR